MRIVADSKIPNAEKEFAPLGDVRILCTPEMTNDNIRNAEAILVRSETHVNASLLNGTQVRFVGTATIGTDHVDLDMLRRNNIAFASCPGSNANSVAEYILATLLELSHRFDVSLRGKTLGIVGHGNTGSRSARKAEAIGMNILLNDPPLARETGDARYLPLNALMEADIISLHVPLTKTGEDPTYHLFDEKRMAAMKRGSILINASRGGVVDGRALKSTLRSNHLRAAVLDVWEGEPDIDIELLQLVALASPHIAGYSYDGKLNATMMLRSALADFLGREGMNGGAQEARSPVEIPLDSENLDLRSLVKRCYDIEVDDATMRLLISTPEAERVTCFRSLRSKYRVRREFHNYFVSGNTLTSSEAALLGNLGFVVL